jgi:prepilin-type N-terminal cleavage/methylation domain-containing protein
MKHFCEASRASGFTLIELLVVMGILSSLVAIALPKYASYRAHGFDTRAELDLRSVAMAEEAYFLQQESYLACANDTCLSLPGIQRLSAGVLLTVRTTDAGFVATASHPRGSGKTFTWDSSLGGMKE